MSTATVLWRIAPKGRSVKNPMERLGLAPLLVTAVASFAGFFFVLIEARGTAQVIVMVVLAAVLYTSGGPLMNRLGYGDDTDGKPMNKK